MNSGLEGQLESGGKPHALDALARGCGWRERVGTGVAPRGGASLKAWGATGAPTVAGQSAATRLNGATFVDACARLAYPPLESDHADLSGKMVSVSMVTFPPSAFTDKPVSFGSAKRVEETSPWLRKTSTEARSINISTV
jgi:hypothetical protein